jgi:hypothetical protein
VHHGRAVHPRINLRTTSLSGWSLVDECRRSKVIPNIESRNSGLRSHPQYGSVRLSDGSKVVVSVQDYERLLGTVVPT